MKLVVLIRQLCNPKPINSKWPRSHQSTRKNCSNQFWFVLFSSIVLFFLFLCLHHLFFFEKMEGLVYFPTTTGTSKSNPIYFTTNSSNHSKKASKSSLVGKDLCRGRYIYVHDLPKRFNDDVLNNCELLTRPKDKVSMCTYIENSGLGPALDSWKNKSWFSTNQFMLEVIFNNRMQRYECLTNDSSIASAVYVPWFAGLDLRRYLWGFNTKARDSSGIELVQWLKAKPEWKTMKGHDHFFVSGRIARDFRRKSDKNSDWGSKFRFLPESRNMSMLTIESGSWTNDIAIPYPTYFHPSSDDDVFEWQESMRRQNRPYLFSFAGASRSGQKGLIRNEIISQCQGSTTLCKFLDCDNSVNKCDDSVSLMKLFQSSVFCLQPPGDSLTRRSTFDSILAGCIPVFFNKGSAYSQYLWHLPEKYSKYSVFISPKVLRVGKVMVNKTLVGVSKGEVLAMREEVIRLIPKIIYADPRSRLETIEDAFDLAIKGILKRIETLRGEFLKL